LLGSGIQADKTLSTDKKGWEVRIAKGDIPRAMQILHAKGLPRRQSFTMGDLFKKDSFATSATQEKALYVFGLEESMRQKLLKIDGVVDAAVSIALPDRDPLGGNEADSSASVFIYQAPGADLRDRETDLKVGVKDSIEGLDDVNKVTIKFFTVGTPVAGKQAVRSPAAMPVLSSISPLAVAITVALAVLLALVIAFGGRLRARLAQPRQPPRVWNG
jgi:type III secretion protein J